MTELETLIIKALEGQPDARAELRARTDGDCIKVAVQIQTLWTRGLLDEVDGNLYPSAAGIRAVYA